MTNSTFHVEPEKKELCLLCELIEKLERLISLVDAIDSGPTQIFQENGDTDA